MEITCPSGLRGTIRGMTGKEAQAFVDPALLRTNGSMAAMLTNCWIDTADPGPYKLVEPKTKGATAKPPWDSLALQGDRYEAIISIRVMTFGAEYVFAAQCQNCDMKYEWELDLNELPRKAYPDASLEKFRSGDNHFQIELPDGKVLDFGIATADTEKKLAALKGGAQSAKKLGPVDAVWAQANGIYVPIVEGGDDAGTNVAAPKFVDERGRELRPIPGGPMGIRRYVETLGFADILDVIARMGDHEGGVETKIETYCEHCNWEQEVELPFQASFFARRKKRTEG